MAYIDKDFIAQDLLPKADLLEVITHFSSDKPKKSGNTYSCCCPFHNEKTPSFHIFPNTQTYKCFGCGAQGNVVDFLMNYEHLGYVAAIEELAKFYGVDVLYAHNPEQSLEKTNKMEQYRVLMERAAKYFEEALKKNPNALNYAKNVRGLSDETIEKARIGYAPNDFRYVEASIEADYEERQLLIDLGIMKKKEDGGSVYSFFRDRLMIPILDVKGRVIAFGGRILNGDDQKGPKYLNSPETPLFHKSRELYGLFETLKAHRNRPPRIVVVEGYMDAISLRQFGFDYVVATLGTAITSEHIKTLFKYTDEVICCFDGDKAGREATWRAVQNITPELNDTKTVRFALVTKGYDPDVLVRTYGAEAFEKILNEAKSYATIIVDHFVLEKISDAADTLQLVQFLREVVGVMKAIPSVCYSSALREECVRRVNGISSMMDDVQKDSNIAPNPKFLAHNIPNNANSNQGLVSGYNGEVPRLGNNANNNVNPRIGNFYKNTLFNNFNGVNNGNAANRSTSQWNSADQVGAYNYDNKGFDLDKSPYATNRAYGGGTQNGINGSAEGTTSFTYRDNHTNFSATIDDSRANAHYKYSRNDSSTRPYPNHRGNNSASSYAANEFAQNQSLQNTEGLPNETNASVNAGGPLAFQAGNYNRAFYNNRGGNGYYAKRRYYARSGIGAWGNAPATRLSSNNYGSDYYVSEPDLDAIRIDIPHWVKVNEENQEVQKNTFDEFLMNLSQMRNSLANNMSDVVKNYPNTILNSEVPFSALNNPIYKFIGLMIQYPSSVVRMVQQHDKSFKPVFESIFYLLEMLKVYDTPLARRIFETITSRQVGVPLEPKIICEKFSESYFGIIVRYLADANLVDSAKDTNVFEETIDSILVILLEVIAVAAHNVLDEARDIQNLPDIVASQELKDRVNDLFRKFRIDKDNFVYDEGELAQV